MDPFSITASAVGITSFAISSIGKLRSLIEGLYEARHELQDIASRLEAIQIPLSALQNLVISDSAIYADAKADIEKAGVPEAVNNCGKACSDFANKLEHWTKHSSKAKLSLRDRLSVGVWNREKIRTLRTQLQSCQAIVQFAVESTQLLIQIRSGHTAGMTRDELRTQMQALEYMVQRHIELTEKGKQDAQKRSADYSEEPDDDEDDGAQRTLALKEVEEQYRLLEADQASSKAVFSHLHRERTAQKIKGVEASDDSIAVAGFINISGDVPNIDQDISDVTAVKGSFAGAGVIIGLNFGDLRSSSNATQRS